MYIHLFLFFPSTHCSGFRSVILLKAMHSTNYDQRNGVSPTEECLCFQSGPPFDSFDFQILPFITPRFLNVSLSWSMFLFTKVQVKPHLIAESVEVFGCNQQLHYYVTF